MNVSLTPELEQFVSQKVESGMYQTASEVIRDGLRLLREKDELRQRKLDDLRKDLAVGLEQADQGKVSAFNEHTIQRIKSRVAGRSSKGAKKR
jgi:antitoxin ParD1/3/4